MNSLPLLDLDPPDAEPPFQQSVNLQSLLNAGGLDAIIACRLNAAREKGHTPEADALLDPDEIARKLDYFGSIALDRCKPGPHQNLPAAQKSAAKAGALAMALWDRLEAELPKRQTPRCSHLSKENDDDVKFTTEAAGPKNAERALFPQDDVPF